MGTKVETGGCRQVSVPKLLGFRHSRVIQLRCDGYPLGKSFVFDVKQNFTTLISWGVPLWKLSWSLYWDFCSRVPSRGAWVNPLIPTSHFCRASQVFLLLVCWLIPPPHYLFTWWGGVGGGGLGISPLHRDLALDESVNCTFPTVIYSG